jgi:hypothetical protein
MCYLVNRRNYKLQRYRYVYINCVIVVTHKFLRLERERKVRKVFNLCSKQRDRAFCITCIGLCLFKHSRKSLDDLLLILCRTLTLLHLRFLFCRVREREVCDTDIPCTFLATPHDIDLRTVRLFFIFFLLLCGKAFPIVIVLSLL